MNLLAELWNELGQMIGCGLVVAALLTPLGWWSARTARRRGERIVPAPRPWQVPWEGFEVSGLFLVVALFCPAVISQTLLQSGLYPAIYGPNFGTGEQASNDEVLVIQSLWTGIVSFPVQLALLIAFTISLFPRRRKPVQPGWHSSLALAVAAWAVLTAAVLTVHFGVTLIFHALGWSVADHPFARITSARPVLDQVLFFVQACIAAPVVEEMLFRGVLLPWLLGRTYRPWLILGIGMLAAGILLGPEFTFTRGPLFFAVALALGWGILSLTMRKKRRTIGAIYASAALFAIVHSAVWPSPIPLFVLGLGLGWLAMRTRGVLVPIIVHGLFNLVSVLFVLSGR